MTTTTYEQLELPLEWDNPRPIKMRVFVGQSEFPTDFILGRPDFHNLLEARTALQQIVSYLKEEGLIVEAEFLDNGNRFIALGPPRPGGCESWSGSVS